MRCSCDQVDTELSRVLGIPVTKATGAGYHASLNEDEDSLRIVEEQPGTALHVRFNPAVSRVSSHFVI